MKDKIKKHLISRLKIGGFIFALVGWLMLITVSLEFVGFKFARLENFFEASTFKWGLRIFLIIILSVLIKGEKIVDGIIERNQLLKNIEIIVCPGNVFKVEANHDVWVKGNDSCVALDFGLLGE